MKTFLSLAVATAVALALPVTQGAAPGAGAVQGTRAVLIEARNLAYDANYRNDQSGLRSALESMQPLAKDAELGAFAHYYASWTYWALTASQIQAKDPAGAIASAKRAVAHARLGLAARQKDPEFVTVLINALIALAIVDQPQLEKLFPEVLERRKTALALAPENPRVVLMDAGIIYFTPPTVADRRKEGLERCEEALRLFEKEAAVTEADPIAPRWGHAMAYTWAATWYLRMAPPQKEKARIAAEAALRMRPDFWWVREQLLPQLRQ